MKVSRNFLKVETKKDAVFNHKAVKLGYTKNLKSQKRFQNFKILSQIRIKSPMADYLENNDKKTKYQTYN